MNRRSSLLAFAAVLALLTSCFSLTPEFKSTYDEWNVRVDSQRDTIEWIEIGHGLDQLQEDARTQLKAVLKGKPVYPAGGGIAWDLDQEIRDVVKIDDVAGARVVEARLVLDTNGAPCLWRRILIEHASAWVATWNAAPGLEDLDAPTVELVEKARESGRRFWSLQGNTIVFEAPLSAACAERVRKSLASNAELESTVVEPVLSFDGTILRLRFAPDATGWLVTPSSWLATSAEKMRAEGRESEMCRNLETRGFRVEPQETYARLRASAGLP